MSTTNRKNQQNTLLSNGDAPQTGSVLLHALHPVNLLSFGPDTPEIPLLPLNLLIGPNGAGKSNFIEAINLLRSTPVSFADILRRGGGVQEWIWKGDPYSDVRLTAQIPSIYTYGLIAHSLLFEAQQQAFRLSVEMITEVNTGLGEAVPGPYFVNADNTAGIRMGGVFKPLPLESFKANDSILAQRRDSEQYPEITYLAMLYSRIRLYREWAFGRHTIFREPQRADMPTDRLEEDFSNLGLYLNRLRRYPDAKNAVLARLHDLYEGVDAFDIRVEGGTVQVYLTEGSFTIPATRLSDGTLRYLCLLAILCDPTPPPLICIEEPELGLHPDILPKIADLLVEASARTQLIVTTHSDILVDAMIERPEVVLVCEKHEGQTQITRLSKDDLSVWLEKYRLGELWTRGELGGTRW